MYNTLNEASIVARDMLNDNVTDRVYIVSTKLGEHITYRVETISPTLQKGESIIYSKRI